MSEVQRLWTLAADGRAPRSAGGRHDARDWQERSEHQNSNELAAQAVARPILGRRLRHDELRVAAPLIHYAFGAGMGALYGVYAQRRKANRTGAAFGTAVWLGADEIAMPVLGLSRSPAERPLETHLQSLAAHLVYGTATELTRRLLDAKGERSRYGYAGKVVLITGGSRGLGLVLARRLAGLGASIALMARDAAELARARETITGGAPVLLLPSDVTDPNSVEQAVHRVVTEFGRLDVVINNAGQILSAPLANTTTEDFKTMLDVHFWGTLHVTKASVPYLARQAGARIINICSIGGRIPVPHLSAYCASKYAQAGLSAVMAEELRQHGIRVTTVLPGLMRTGSHVQARFKGRPAREYTVFALAGGLPLSSMSAERAARLILAAAARGNAEAIIPFTVRQIAKASALFPNAVSRGLAAVNSVLPGEGTDRAVAGAALPLSAATRFAIGLNERAADRNNER